MKKLILLLLIPMLSHGALTNIVVKPNANPDTLGEWATKINSAIDQVNTNTTTIGSGGVVRNPSTENVNMATYSITNVTDVVATNSASLTNNAADILELQANAIASNVWAVVAASTNASGVNVADAGGYYASNTVEGALYEAGLSYLSGSDLYPPISAVDGNAIELWILWGQSNMEGDHDDGFGQLPYQLQGNQVDALYWAYVYQSPGNLDVNNTNVYPAISERWGPEIIMADRMLRTRRKIAFVKAARGGTDLEEWLTGTNKTTGLPFTPTEPYYNLTNKVSTAISDLEGMGYDVKIRGIVSMQGESDASLQSTATNYYSNYLTLIGNLKTDCGIDADVPVYIGRISGTASGVTGRGYDDVVYQAQTDLATSNDNYYVIDTDNIPVNASDNLHFTGTGMIELSERFLDSIHSNEAPLSVYGETLLDGTLLGQAPVSPYALEMYYPFENDVVGGQANTMVDWSPNNYNCSNLTASIDFTFEDSARGGTVTNWGAGGGWIIINSNTYTEVTFAAMVKTDTPGVVEFLAKVDNAWQVWLDSDADINFRIYISAASKNAAQVRIEKNKWVFISCTWDGTNQKIYVNGELESTTPQTGTMDTMTSGLARMFTSTSSNPYTGYADDFTVYSRALSDDEIKRLYRQFIRGEKIIYYR